MEWSAIRTVKDFLAWLSEGKETPYQRSLDRARRQVADVDPLAVSRRSGAGYQIVDGGGGVFILPFLGQNYIIGYPGFKIVGAETGQEPSVYRQIIMLHYLKTMDDAYVPAGFVVFGALTCGRPYERSLQHSALEPLARAYADNLNHFRLAAQALGGRPLKVEGSKGVAFSFWPLPRLPMGLVLTPGDAEFPVRAQLLVDVNTERWLPVYDAAIVGRLLCQTLTQLKPVGGRAARLSEITVRDDGALYGAG